MEFKIDTKDSYSIVTPLKQNFDANLAGVLIENCRTINKDVCNNLIINLTDCINIDDGVWKLMNTLHDDCYENEASVVFIDAQKYHAGKAHEKLHIVPTMAEAVDIISMEILERELMNDAE